MCEFKRTASLSISSLYEKIVLKKRGGYCYELNALFASLLTACGYEVTPCMARIIRDCDDEFIPPISHRINLVRIDGQESKVYKGNWNFKFDLKIDPAQIQTCLLYTSRCV